MALNYTEEVTYEYDEWAISPDVTYETTIARKVGHWKVTITLCEFCTPEFIDQIIQNYIRRGYVVTTDQPVKPDEPIDMLNTTITAKIRSAT